MQLFLNLECINIILLLLHFGLKNTFLGFTTFLGQKLLHFWVLLQFWAKSYYISGFTTLRDIYYISGSNKCLKLSTCNYFPFGLHFVTHLYHIHLLSHMTFIFSLSNLQQPSLHLTVNHWKPEFIKLKYWDLKSGNCSISVLH